MAAAYAAVAVLCAVAAAAADEDADLARIPDAAAGAVAAPGEPAVVAPPVLSMPQDPRRRARARL